jgi:hypothetical protein
MADGRPMHPPHLRCARRTAGPTQPDRTAGPAAAGAPASPRAAALLGAMERARRANKPLLLCSLASVQCQPTAGVGASGGALLMQLS